MKAFWQKLHDIGDFLHLPDMPNWLVGILALVIILRVPSFFEPYYYGDEMIYLTLGQGVRQGLTLYSQVYDNKPPLLYLTAAVAGNLFWFKAILTLWSLVTIVFFYKLSKTLLGPSDGNKKTQKLATFLFALLTTLPHFEGHTVNAELFMIGPSIVAFLLLLKNNLNFKKIYFAGILFGIATLFKVPAMFDVPVIMFFWLFTQGFGSWKKIGKNTIILTLGFATPIVLTFAWYFFRGILPDYIKAAFLQNVGYLSSFRPGDVQKSFLVRNAPLLIRGLIVLVGLGITYVFRKRLSKRFIFLTVWILFTLFAVALSERPYPHYFLQAIPAVSLFLGILFTDPGFEQSLTVIPLTLAFFVPVYYKFWFYPTTSYYVRFVNFATHKINKAQYFDGFSKTVNRNYAIADFLSTSTTAKDKVFMWDPDSSTVYALSRRQPPIKFVADYHVNDYSSKSEVAKQLAINPPKFIILTAGHNFTELGSLIKGKYLLINQVGDSDIYSRIDFAPR